MAADPYDSVIAKSRGVSPVPSTATTANSGGTATTTGTSTQTSNQNTETSRNLSTTNMDPASLAALQKLIGQLLKGGTPEQQVENAKRAQITQMTEALMGLVSPDRAFEESKGLMALNLQQAMEKNMPAIQRAIEGAGTSASSMQGLLSQSAARDASLAASALGGEQAKTYAAQRTGLASVLEALTRPTNTVTSSLLNALNTAKGAVVNSSETGTSNTSGSQTTNTSSTTNTGPTTKTDTYAPRTDTGGAATGTPKYIDIFSEPSTSGILSSLGTQYSGGQSLAEFLTGYRGD